MPDFKGGDRVRLLLALAGFYPNMVGTVASVGPNGIIRVNLHGTYPTTILATARDLALAPIYAVGQRVRVTKDVSNALGEVFARTGDEGTVTIVDVFPDAATRQPLIQLDMGQSELILVDEYCVEPVTGDTLPLVQPAQALKSRFELILDNVLT